MRIAMLPVVPFVFLVQISTAAAAPCPVTLPVQAKAPPDQSADPISGYWHISADRLLWAPAGTIGTDVGRYWVRPAGFPLEFSGRRLDVPGAAIISTERSDYPTGFYFGSLNIPTEGCWEVTATAGFSSVTFVTEIRYSMENFARQPGTRITWSKEIGRIEEGATQLVVTALVLEDPQSVTRSARGVRIDVTDGVTSTHLWQENSNPAAARRAFGPWAEGALPMLHSLGGYYAKGDMHGLSLVRGEHQYVFQGVERSAELARLLLRAIDELSAD